MKISSEQEMLDFGREFAKKVPTPVIELIGDVGAGKTTFVRGLAEGLGIKEPVTSPSFTISKSYALPDGRTLTHYDFYRLDNVGIMAENLREAINNNSIIIVEWGNSVENILPEERCVIELKLQDNGNREIIVKDNCKNTFRDHTRSPLGTRIAEGKQTWSGTSEVSPVTTGANERVEESVLRLSLDTSTNEVILKINNKTYKQLLGHDMAEKLLQFIHDKLAENNKDFKDITEIEFMSGPGSFTGLRIGATVVNTLAHELNIPLYDHHGNKHKQIIPDYGRPANITKPIK